MASRLDICLSVVRLLLLAESGSFRCQATHAGDAVACGRMRRHHAAAVEVAPYTSDVPSNVELRRLLVAGVAANTRWTDQQFWPHALYVRTRRAASSASSTTAATARSCTWVAKHVKAIRATLGASRRRPPRASAASRRRRRLASKRRVVGDARVEDGVEHARQSAPFTSAPVPLDRRLDVDGVLRLRRRLGRRLLRRRGGGARLPSRASSTTAKAAAAAAVAAGARGPSR